MFTTRSKTGNKNEIAAVAATTLMLLALLVKAILPAGFMPSVDKGGLTQIVICSGMGEKTITITTDETPESNHQGNTKADKVCAFQTLASGKIFLDAPAFTLAAPVFSTVPADFSNSRAVLSSLNISLTARGPPSA